MVEQRPPEDDAGECDAGAECGDDHAARQTDIFNVAIDVTMIGWMNFLRHARLLNAAPSRTDTNAPE